MVSPLVFLLKFKSKEKEIRVYKLSGVYVVATHKKQKIYKQNHTILYSLYILYKKRR